MKPRGMSPKDEKKKLKLHATPICSAQHQKKKKEDNHRFLKVVWKNNKVLKK